MFNVIIVAVSASELASYRTRSTSTVPGSCVVSFLLYAYRKVRWYGTQRKKKIEKKVKS